MFSHYATRKISLICKISTFSEDLSFLNPRSHLNLFSWPSKVNVCNDKVQGIILNFLNHPSILKIKEKFQLNKRFSFQHVSEATVTKVVKNLPSDKVSAGKISIKVLKESKFCFPEPTNCINESLTSSKFPDTSKLFDITPIFLKIGS